MVVERLNVPGTVSGRRRSSAVHVRSVRKDDMIGQRHLRYRFLKAQGTSIFAIVNPECPILCGKVTNHLRVRRVQYLLTDVIIRL